MQFELEASRVSCGKIQWSKASRITPI